MTDGITSTDDENSLEFPHVVNDKAKDMSVKTSKKRCFNLPIRYVIVVLCGYVTLTMGLIRFCMGMAIVCMTNHTAILAQETISSSNFQLYCVKNDDFNTTEDKPDFHEDGPFEWSDNLQGTILSSYFWGYIIPQIPAGIIVDKYSCKWIMSVTLLLSSLLCMAIPVSAVHFHVWTVITLNFLIGFIQSFVYPIIYVITSRWSPKNERAVMITIATFGHGLGQMSVNYISAYLCSSNLESGWKNIFYLYGVCGIISAVVWMLIIENHPQEHRWVSISECNYIKSTSDCRHHLETNIKIPWRNIFMSAPVWAVIGTEIIFSFRSNLIFTDLPTYMKVIMNFDIRKNGIINSVPYIIKCVMSITMAFASDAIIASGKASVTNLRKTALSLISLVACSCLLGVVLAGCHKLTVVILFSIMIAFDGLGLIAVYMNPMDLAPNFVGSLKGITNVGSGFGNLVAPAFVGWMLTNDDSISSWNKIFYILIGLNISAWLLYLVFGSGNVQRWNSLNRKNDENNDFTNNDYKMLIKNTQLSQSNNTIQ